MLNDPGVMGAIYTLRKTSKKIGAAEPKQITAAYELAAKIDAAAGNVAPSDHDFKQRVIECADQGIDLTGDAEIQRMMTGSWFAEQGRRRAGLAAGDVVAEAYRANLPAVLDSWHAVFAPAAAALTNAYGLIGDVPLDDAEKILGLGSKAAAAWGPARAANGTIAQIAQIWSSLDTVTSFASGTTQWKTLRIADPAENGSVDLRRADITAWQALQRGFKLDLADGKTFKQRVQTIEAEAQREADEEAEQADDARQRRISTV